MLVTAIALFFSTFSSPFLSAGAHARAVGDRPLQRRPQELRGGGGSRAGRAGWRAGCTTCCRTSRRFDIKTAGRLRAAGARAPISRRSRSTARVCIALLLCGVGGDLLAPGLQVAMATRTSYARAARAAAGVGGLQALQGCASAAASCRHVRRACSTCARPRLLRAHGAVVSRRCVADVYWIRAVQHYGDTKLGRTADRSYGAAAIRLLDLTTSLDPLLRRGLPVRRALPRRGAAGRAGPARSGDPAARERARARSPTTGSCMQAIGFVHYWSTRTTPRRPSGSSAARVCPARPTWMEPLAAVTLAEGGEPRSRRACCGSRF
mgnify:CR=1 FL=1